MCTLRNGAHSRKNIIVCKWAYICTYYTQAYKYMHIYTTMFQLPSPPPQILLQYTYINFH